MLPALDSLSFMAAPRPQGWVQHGDRWGLWWGSREVASVQPDAHGIRVTLSCRKLWQDKKVRASSIVQGKRYAERWCAVRILEGVPLKEAVARLAQKDRPPVSAKLTRTQIQQERRLDAVPKPKL